MFFVSRGLAVTALLVSLGFNGLSAADEPAKLTSRPATDEQNQSAQRDAAAPARPNLIWIMADDLGFAELGCYGQQEIATPHLDRMAAEGMRFTRFYAGATVCAPSRCVLMTGLHQGHARVRGNGGPQIAMEGVTLQPDDVTVAKLLASAGYETIHVGKWGLGDVGAMQAGLPTRQGFQSFFGYLEHVHAHNHFPDFLYRNEDRVPLPNIIHRMGKPGAGYATSPLEYADDRFADEAIRFVQSFHEAPFFLYWSMVVPHANNERKRALGNGAEVPSNAEYAGRPWDEATKGHAAMISRMDGYVGRLLQALRDSGKSRSTLVVFTSDNGPHDESGHRIDQFKPTGPLRGIKRSLTDGGIRVPMIAWWPETIIGGTTTEHAAYFGDWMATACELAGAKLPEDRDSISFVPTLCGQGASQPKHPFLYWEFHEGGFQQATLYEQRWKAIRSGGLTKPLTLYDQQTDPGETIDVASQFPDVIATIEQYLVAARTPSPHWEPKWPTPKTQGAGR
jgi:arylsulfatase A-like enzyme